MKTLKIIPALFTLSLFLILSACSKDAKVTTEDLLPMAGTIHNQLLENYYQNRLNVDPDMESMINEIIELSSDYLVSEGYDRRTIDEAEQSLKEKFGPSRLKNITNDDYSINIGNLASELQDLSLYSEKFLSELVYILEMVEEDADFQHVYNYINTKFLYLTFESKKDQEGQTLFTNIFNGSFSFWTNETNTCRKAAELDPSSWVIINDAIGGILGSVFGPVGSIIGAAVLSVGTNEEIKNS